MQLGELVFQSVIKQHLIKSWNFKTVGWRV